MDFESMNLLLKRKPTKKSIELEVNKKYPLLKMMVLDTKYGPNIKIETPEFFCFIPNRYYQYLKESGVKKIQDMLNQGRPIYILSMGAVSKTVEEDGDVNILHIIGVSHLDNGQVRCVACIPSEEKRRHSLGNARCENTSSIANENIRDIDQQVCISCSTELTVIPGRSFNTVASDSASLSMNASVSSAEVLTDYNMKKKSEEPAVILRGPQDTTALVGDRVLLKATYVGHPEPTVRWTRGGKELVSDERTSITSNHGVACLLLHDITTDDSGKYDISIDNGIGSDRNYASLSVEGPPDPPGGKPSITAGVDTATVTWSSSPYDGGRIVTGFALEYLLLGSDIWTTAADNCHSLSYTVRGLQSGAIYIFRVRAINIHGSSPPGMESDKVQLIEPDESCPFAPRLVSMEPGSEFKVRYEVLEELGKGRYGVVHKVVDKSTSQKLAAKFVRCRTAKDREKVQDEVDIMNLLRHPKLLQLAAAFENPRESIMVMEYISGGELFERVVADDFTLTERDCILFMRQICEGVAYMHTQSIVHLDLKPENIMCHTRTSHEIKIIDFGLAHKLLPDNPIRVLFGTPEFIPPEIINYEPIGVRSDMWSVGVICYVLLSGLSPFMGDNDAETFANITRANYDFDDEAFDAVSENAREFIGALLIKKKESRMSADDSLKHSWLDPESHQDTVILSTDKLKKFIIRRKWQKTGNAIRAVGRMANLSATRRNSSNSSSTTPRSSVPGNGHKMSSLNEEEISNVDEASDLSMDSSNVISIHEEGLQEAVENKENLKNYSRVCSERSDSGFSDCSILASCSCSSTPLLGKNHSIDEEPIDCNNTTKSERFRLQIEQIYKTNLGDIISNTNNTFLTNTINGENNNEVYSETPLLKDQSTQVSYQLEDNNNNNSSSSGGSTELEIKHSNKICNTIEQFNGKIVGDKSIKGKSPDLPVSIRRLSSPKSISSVIQKYNELDKSVAHISNELMCITSKPQTNAAIEDTSFNNVLNDDNIVSKSAKTVRYRSPSPSLLKKTQSVIAKEQKVKNGNSANRNSPPKALPKSSCDVMSVDSTSVNKKIENKKPKSDSFKKAAEFWNKK